MTGVMPKGPLGDAETRLRHLLEQEGSIPLTLDYGIVPVVLVGNGTLPGMADLRGRKFKGTCGATGPGNAAYFTAAVDVVIERINIQCDQNAGADTLTVGIVPSVISVPGALSPNVDRFVSVNDLAPVLTQAGGSAPLADLDMFIALVPGSATAQTYQFEAVTTPFLLRANCSVQLVSGTARTLRMNFEGYRF